MFLVNTPVAYFLNLNDMTFEEKCYFIFTSNSLHLGMVVTLAPTQVGSWNFVHLYICKNYGTSCPGHFATGAGTDSSTKEEIKFFPLQLYYTHLASGHFQVSMLCQEPVSPIPLSTHTWLHTLVLTEPLEQTNHYLPLCLQHQQLIYSRTPLLCTCWETAWRPVLSANLFILGNFARNDFLTWKFLFTTNVTYNYNKKWYHTIKCMPYLISVLKTVWYFLLVQQLMDGSKRKSCNNTLLKKPLDNVY